MAEPIFLRHQDGTLREMVPQGFETEAVLQEILAMHPRLLLSTETGAPQRLLLLAREADLADSDTGPVRWSVDHLLLDESGVPVIVEVKRSTDTRIRREVVGQMLDYAANAVLYWPVERLRSMFAATCVKAGIDAEATLRDHTGPEADVERFWETVGTNMQAGKIRLVFVADQVPIELQRIIEFLNGQMSQADVLGVEVRRYASADGEVLVPRFIGRTSAAERAKTGGERARRRWDEESFLAALEERRGASARAVAARLIEWCRPRFGRIFWGTGALDGSFVPVQDGPQGSFYPLGAWTYGRVEIQFQYLAGVRPFDDVEERRELQRRLNAIPGVQIGDDRLTKRPSLQLSQLEDEEAFQQFVSAIEWALRRFISAYSTGADASME